MNEATATTESWDDRIAREKREERALVDEFVAKLKTMDLPGWDCSVDCSDAYGPHTVSFDHKETGASFSVTLPGRYASRHGKVEAKASWPKDANGSSQWARDWGLIGYNDSDPYTIGFSYKKTAKAIASDLKRRLIPGILEGIAIINAKLEKQRESQGTIERDVEKLRKAFSMVDIREQTYCAAKIHFDGGNARLSTYGSKETGENCVDLEIRNLTVKQAMAIAKILKTS